MPSDSNNNDKDENRSDEMNYDRVDWVKFENCLRKEKFKSKYLQMIDKSELKSFGIDDYCARNDVNRIIQDLCENNPVPRQMPLTEDANCEGQVITGVGGTNDDLKHNSEIDSKYICPLTKKVMTNPVIAFDDECYENEAIISYLRRYKQSPITKEKIDDVEFVVEMLFENKNLKKEIKQKGLL